MDYIDKIMNLGACDDAVEWLRESKHKTMQLAWDKCQRGDWMMFLMQKTRAGNQRNLRLLACDCAERALMRERKSGREPDARCWEAVRVARRFARGRATREEMETARKAAAYAADAAYAAYAAYAAAYAADAAAAAAAADAAAAAAAAYAAAYSAAYAARLVAWAEERTWQAKRVRHYFPKAPRLGHVA